LAAAAIAMSRPFRIATFNLENLGGAPDEKGRLDSRIRVLRPQLLRLDADVLCLQEVNAQPSTKGGPRVPRALDRLLQDTPYEGFRRFAGGGTGEHLPIRDTQEPQLARLSVQDCEMVNICRLHEDAGRRRLRPDGFPQ